jgi:hypothetical protein
MILSLPPGHIRNIESAKARWEAAYATDRPAVYRTEVFPFAVARLLTQRGDQPASHLLVVPVGTQAFAPLLAALATPAHVVALLRKNETPSRSPKRI